MRPGGYVRTPEIRAAASAKLKGRKLSPEHRAAISAAQMGHSRGVGRKLSAEHRASLSRASRRLGNPGHHPSEETRAKMRAAHIGRQYRTGWRATEEQKRARSERMRVYMNTPERHAKQAKILRSVCRAGGLATRGMPRHRYTPTEEQKRAQSERLRAKFAADPARREKHANILRSVCRAGGLAFLESNWRKRVIEYLDRLGRVWKFRSGYELRYAKLLDREALTWTYEPDRLLLSDGRIYVPDFWISEWQAYVEVKGWSRWRGDKIDIARRDGHLVFMVGRSIVGRK